MNASLFGLAVIKVNWDHKHHDYIDILVPMVAECIRENQYTVVSLPELQQHFQFLFGLRLPQHVLKSVVKRMRSRRLVRLANRVYYPVYSKLNNLNFSPVRHSVIRMHNDLVDAIRRFVLHHFKLEWSEEDAEIALQSYLSEREQMTYRSLIAPASAQPTEGAQYIVAEFVRYVVDNESPEAEYIDTIVKGSMLANAIFLTEPCDQQMRFRKTDVYLDTPILMNALGYNGEPRQVPCVELLDLVRSAGGRLRCFSHTVDEIRGILYAHASSLQQSDLSNAYGPAFEFFLSQGFTASDVELLAVSLEAELTKLHVSIVDKPKYVSKYVIDESGLESALIDKVKYSRPAALKHDVDCISAIARLRQGRSPRRLEDCRALFITQNVSLVWASQDFFSREYPRAVPPCVTDYALTSLLWLKLPSVAPDLPMKRLIANCYAAVQPDGELWSKYLEEVERLKQSGGCTADEYYALRCSLHAKNALMEYTLGVEEAFAEGVVHEVLSIAKDRIAAEARSDAERELKTEREKRIEAEKAASDAARKVKNMQERISSIAASLASGIVYVLRVLLGIALAIGGAMPLLEILLKGWVNPTRLKWMLGCIALWIVYSYLSTVHGVTVNEMSAKLCTRLESWIASCISAGLLGLDQQNVDSTSSTNITRELES